MTTRYNNEDNPPKKRKISIWKIVSRILQVSVLLVLMGAFFAGGAATGYVASLVKDDPLRSHDEINDTVFSNYLTGFAYFNENTPKEERLIGQLRAEEDRRLVTKDEVSTHLINAIIATEDRHFYEHRGVDPSGILRATVQDITGSSVQTGGSTLTQQLIKQTLLSPKVTHERKAKEIFLALRMERMFSKDQILEAYMNEMYFGQSANGSNIYGVQAAAKGIFGVDAKDLNISQAAYIAGMLQAPSRYIPFDKDGLAAGKKRQEIVLNRMEENGYITREQYEEAIKYDIGTHLAQSKPRAYSQYPFLMMEIEERAARVLVEKDLSKDPKAKESLSREEYRQLVDNKRKEILRGGYHIYTTIDKKIYEMMTEIAENPENFGPNRTYKVTVGSEVREIKDALEEVGATLIDNRTGAILGFIGGRDFKTQQVNHATRPRQPGSAMKPIAAYAPAFEKGLLQPGSAIDDAPIALDNGVGNPPFYPSNWNNKFQGLITVREALRQSYNIPAIKAYLQVGIPEALSYVEQTGVTTLITPKDNPRVNDYQAKTGVIGGLTQGLTVEEITNAYSVFPNQGSFMDAYLIQRIENSEGEKIFENQISPTQVYSEQTSYLITDMMRTVVRSGTGASLPRLIKGNRDIAGKTGTTNDDVDSWFVGYTPEVTLGVWVGYDIPYTLTKSSPPRPIQIWGKVMNGLIDLYPEDYPEDSKFVQPSGVVRREICRVSGKLPTDLCREAGTVITEVFNQNYVPTESCDVHQHAKVIEYDGKMYLAQDETPEDMVQSKVAMKSPDPLVIPDRPNSRVNYTPLDAKDRLPDQKDPRQDNGKVPDKLLNVEIKNGKLVWGIHPENDVVGYRIYRSIFGSPFEKVGVVFQSSDKVYELKEPGMYYITAVDVVGKESEPTDAIVYGDGGGTGPNEPSEPQDENGGDPLDGVLPPVSPESPMEPGNPEEELTPPNL
ncbi:transglycosylase domain-containing protein [Ammoniphilus resinae]|uniref:Penicillin-binding protein n=1 Tax=Ammoniphilus resinae TaxID=861532 RepID=A0ABS4GRP0_9BACL|nr:PBP1A family penicillin-binding protein [Ammoniphilus resinae]MBP1932924.1 penicillin-binding protein [Ammoniphilus resinae]